MNARSYGDDVGAVKNLAVDHVDDFVGLLFPLHRRCYISDTFDRYDRPSSPDLFSVLFVCGGWNSLEIQWLKR